MDMEKLELIPNQSQIAKPLFNTREDYESFRITFGDSIKDVLRKQALDRAESARNLLPIFKDKMRYRR